MPFKNFEFNRASLQRCKRKQGKQRVTSQRPAVQRSHDLLTNSPAATLFQTAEENSSSPMVVRLQQSSSERDSDGAFLSLDNSFNTDKVPHKVNEGNQSHPVKSGFARLENQAKSTHSSELSSPADSVRIQAQMLLNDQNPFLCGHD